MTLRLVREASKEKTALGERSERGDRRRGAGGDRGREGGPGLEHETLVEGYLADLGGRRQAAATVAARGGSLRVLGGWLADAAIADARQMTRADVDRYVSWLRGGSHYAPRTAEQHVQGLKLFFDFLVGTNRLLLSPAEHVRLRKVEHLVGSTISTAEADRVLAAPNTSLPAGVRDRAILELLYGNGLRRGELVRLTVFDVDLAGGLLRVLGKGGIERLAPLGRHARKWLRAYLHEVRPTLGRRAKVGQESHALFLSTKRGEPLTAIALTQILDEASKKAGVRASCHTFRRTMATEVLRGGASIVDVAALLGHRRLQTTQRYTKVAAVDLRRVHAESHPRGR